MGDGWQISAGYLSEYLRPAAYALAAALSALVLADARRFFGSPAVAVWTLLTLALPQVVLPLYLVARMFSTRRHEAESTQPESDAKTSADDSENSDDEGRRATSDEPARTAETQVADAAQGHSNPATEQAHTAGDQTADKAKRLKWRFALPLLYAAVVFAAGALYFYTEHGTADAHLYRARTAKLFGQRERTLSEYRAALALEDDAHTHKLLGVELSGAGLWQEALTEFRAAEEKGEPDEALPFHVATALNALGRAPEAAAEYQKFLRTALCAQTPPDARCEKARSQVRLAERPVAPE